MVFILYLVKLLRHEFVASPIVLGDAHFEGPAKHFSFVQRRARFGVFVPEELDERNSPTLPLRVLQHCHSANRDRLRKGERIGVNLLYDFPEFLENLVDVAICE